MKDEDFKNKTMRSENPIKRITEDGTDREDFRSKEGSKSEIGIEEFFQDQVFEWEMASINYRDLKDVVTKVISLNGFELLVQFNPNRITSSTAKIDVKSIQNRPCFLCLQNRPHQQKGISFKSISEPNQNEYDILVNPFPIFPKHLTISHKRHIPQQIFDHFEDMLDLSCLLNNFVVFYNGPQCGASAPDHFHFQAGSKGFLPIENDFHQGKNHRLFYRLAGDGGLNMYRWAHYLRTAITIQSSNKTAIVKAFGNFYDLLKKKQSHDEPMINILCLFENDKWIVHIFPRKRHRPSQYFEEGERQLLFSPASVDMGGVITIPRWEDFLKITKKDVEDIFRQVCMDDETINRLLDL